MPSQAVTEMILVIMVIVIGVAATSFAYAYLIPQLAFSAAESAAANIASSTVISVGPYIGNNVPYCFYVGATHSYTKGYTFNGSVVIDVSNPSVNSTVYVVVFQPGFSITESLGEITPLIGAINPNLTVASINIIEPNGQTYQVTKTSAIYFNSTPIYSLGGTILCQPSPTDGTADCPQYKIIGYPVKFNTPFVINLNVARDNIVIIWFIIKEGEYYFRIGYTYVTPLLMT